MSYTFYSKLILLGENSDANLAALKEYILAFYKRSNTPVSITVENDEMTINISGYQFYIGENKEDYVVQESAEMAKDAAKDHPDKKIIAQCKRRFEMSGDQDPEMDYFNDSLFLLDHLAKFSEVYIFDPQNIEFVEAM